MPFFKHIKKIEKPWEKEWQDMPEFIQKDETSFRQIIVHFKTQKDVDVFAKLIGQKISKKRNSLWYPGVEIGRFANKRYIDES
mgnify:CR=1 FL=1